MNDSGHAASPSNRYRRPALEPLPLDSWALDPGYDVPSALTRMAARDYHLAVRRYSFHLSLEVERATYVARKAGQQADDEHENNVDAVKLAIRALHSKIVLHSSDPTTTRNPMGGPLHEGPALKVPPSLTRSARRRFERAVMAYAAALTDEVERAGLAQVNPDDEHEYNTNTVVIALRALHSRIDLATDEAQRRHSTQRLRRASGNGSGAQAWSFATLVLAPVAAAGSGIMAGFLNSPWQRSLFGVLIITFVGSSLATWIARGKHRS